MEAVVFAEPRPHAPAPVQNGTAIKDILKEAINWWGWQERIRYDAETGTDFVTTTYIKHNEAFVYALTSNEKARKVGIHVSSPIQVPPVRIVETILVANYFNMRSTTGGYHVTGAGDLCYRWVLSVAGTQPSIETFRALRDAANKAFEETYTPFLTAAFTAHKASDITRKFEIFASSQ